MFRVLKDISGSVRVSVVKGSTVPYQRVSFVPIPVGSVIEITDSCVMGWGSDPWPEQEAVLADGRVVRIGFGVTVERGYLEQV